MIPKKLETIEKADLELLVHNSVPEGKTIDYKEELPSNSDADKKEFLADVSSFANIVGGDLIFGIKEEERIPIEISGVELADADLEVSRLESIIRDGIEPRIQSSIRVVAVDGSKKVIIIRVKESWIRPHRVIFKAWDKFFGRNSSGKYPLDVSELRAIFTLSDTIAKKIQDFRLDRIIELASNRTPIPLQEGAKVILHLIPFESFGTKTDVDFMSLYNDPAKLRPMRATGWSRKLNLEGLVAYTGGEKGPSYSYVQLYRNGIIEAVEELTIKMKGGQSFIPMEYEKITVDYLQMYLEILKEFNINVPIFLFLTLTGVKGVKMGYDTSGLFPYDDYPIDRDMLILPEAVIENFNQDLKEALRPTFSLVWNACGIPRSLSYDKDGNWTWK